MLDGPSYDSMTTAFIAPFLYGIIYFAFTCLDFFEAKEQLKQLVFLRFPYFAVKVHMLKNENFRTKIFSQNVYLILYQESVIICVL